MQEVVCWRGERKKVPSIKGYLDYTSQSFPNHETEKSKILSESSEKTAKTILLPLKDVHHAVAEDAGHPVHLVGGVVGQDEAPGLVVADAALVLHLDVVRVDLRPGQDVE